MVRRFKFFFLAILFFCILGLRLASSFLGIPYPVGTRYYFTYRFKTASGFSKMAPYVLYIKSENLPKHLKLADETYGVFFSRSEILADSERVQMHCPVDGFLNFLIFEPYPSIRTNYNTWRDTINRGFAFGFAVVPKKSARERIKFENQYTQYMNPYPGSRLALEYTTRGKKDTVINNKHYSDYCVYAESVVLNKKYPKINNSKGEAMYLYKENIGFEYMQFSFADSLFASIQLDSVQVINKK